jgi:hypothetical protein
MCQKLLGMMLQLMLHITPESFTGSNLFWKIVPQVTEKGFSVNRNYDYRGHDVSEIALLSKSVMIISSMVHCVCYQNTILFFIGSIQPMNKPITSPAITSKALKALQ